MTDKKNFLTDLLKKDKVRNIVILAGICGILLIYISTFFTDSKKNNDVKPEGGTETHTVTEFETHLEVELCRIVSAITGEDAPEILITLERDIQNIYGTDEKESSQTNAGSDIKEGQSYHDYEKNHIILKDADGNQQALKVTEFQPEIRGVVVVSKEGSNSVMQERIVEAMKTALGISSAKICVVVQSS